MGWGELDAERQQQATDSSLLSPSFVYLFLSSSDGAKRRRPRRRPDYFRLCSTLLRALALFDKQAKGLRRLLFLQNKNISLLSFPLFDFCSSTFYRSACLSSSAAAATAFLSVASRVFPCATIPTKRGAGTICGLQSSLPTLSLPFLSWALEINPPSAQSNSSKEQYSYF